MLREVAIIGYLLFFKLFFTIFSLLPQQNKVCLVISFEENALFLYRQLKGQQKVVILHKTSLSEEFKKELDDTQSIPFESKGFANWLRSIYQLATAKWLIVDNYFGFLSTVKFKENVECIQIWHAAGALKTFGLQDKSIKERTPAAKRRFQKVYNQFNQIVVGSEEMAVIFSDSFQVSLDKMLRTGIPRTDLFYDERLKQECTIKFFKEYPALFGKKLILYAPTYRDGQLDNNQLHLDLQKMKQALGDRYSLLIKLHPAVQTENQFEDMCPGFVYDLSAYKRVNELLVVADYLITDYSSLPFEYALLDRPMIFYPYDLEEYRDQRGLMPDYQELVPGPIVYDTDQLIKVIEENNFDFERIQQFSNRWNKYSTGRSAENLVKYIMTEEQD